jgi:hypothetical protein
MADATYSRDDVIKLLENRDGVEVTPIDNDTDRGLLIATLEHKGIKLPAFRIGDIFWSWKNRGLPGVTFAFSYALLGFVEGKVQNVHVGPSNPSLYGEFLVTGDTPILKERNGRQWNLLNGTEG